MAETTKTASKSDAKKRVTVKIPLAKGQNAVQQEFISVNFKNYIIQRGEEVEVPEAVAEAIENADKAEEYALKYANKMVLKESK